MGPPRAMLMIKLWIFWIEIMAFSLYMLGTMVRENKGTTGYGFANVIIYSIALAYGLIGFARFIRRRLAIPRTPGS